ncbi:MAG: type III secretion system chaperone [Chlamydiae bacterium]|nr:type III secretion system chaperone [Chlamydiota bacterium]
MNVLENNLNALSKELDFTIDLVKEGIYRIPINEKLTISLKPEESGFSLFSPIIACPKKYREELFMFLMKANFLGQGTLEAIIGFDQDEKFLTLSFQIPYDMNYRAFKEKLEDFSNVVDYWRGEIVQFEKTKEAFFS